MIKEELVTKEVAELANKCGFKMSGGANWWIRACDRTNNHKVFFAEDSQDLENQITDDNDDRHNVYHVLSCPTQSVLQRWLRDEQAMIVTILPYTVDDITDTDSHLSDSTFNFIVHNNGVWSECNCDFVDYEDAMAAGLLAALKILE